MTAFGVSRPAETEKGEAHDRKGDLPDLNDFRNDFFFLPPRDPASLAMEAAELVGPLLIPVLEVRRESASFFKPLAGVSG